MPPATSAPVCVENPPFLNNQPFVLTSCGKRRRICAPPHPVHHDGPVRIQFTFSGSTEEISSKLPVIKKYLTRRLPEVGNHQCSIEGNLVVCTNAIATDLATAKDIVTQLAEGENLPISWPEEGEVCLDPVNYASQLLGPTGELCLELSTRIAAYAKRHKIQEKINISVAPLVATHEAFAHRHSFPGASASEFDRSYMPNGSRAKLLELLRRCNTDGGNPIKLQTGHRGQIKYGRLYDASYGQFVYLPSRVRDLCLVGMCEVDMASAHLRIMLQFAQKAGLEVEALERLVTNKEAEYASIAEFYGPDTRRSQVKQIVLGLGYGGRLKNMVSGVLGKAPEHHHPMLVAFASIVDDILKKVIELHPQLAEHVQKVCKIDDQFKLQKSVLSYFAQEIECVQAALAVNFLISRGAIPKVGDSYQLSWLHDGIYLPNNDTLLTPQLLKELALFVKLHTGLDTVWGVKQVNPSLSEPEQQALDTLKHQDSHTDSLEVLAQGCARRLFPHLDQATFVFERESGLLKVAQDSTMRFEQIGVDGLAMEIYHQGSGALLHRRTFFHETLRLQDKEIAEALGYASAQDILGVDARIRLEHEPGQFMEFPSELTAEAPTERTLVLVKASMGSGKTHAMLNTLIKPTTQRGGSVLVIMPRVSLAQEFAREANAAGVPLTLYSADHDSNCLVTTIESLPLKARENKDYDLVCIDETSVVRAEFTAGHIKDAGPFEAFKRTLANSKLIVCTDADMDKDTAHHMRGLANSTKTLGIYFVNSTHRQQIIQVPDQEALFGEIIRAIVVEGSPVAVACSTSKGPRRIADVIKAYVMGEVDLFGKPTSRTPQAVMKEVAMFRPVEPEVFLAEVLNGCLVLSGAFEPGMDARKKRAFGEGCIESKLADKEIWHWNGSEWVQRSLKSAGRMVWQGDRSKWTHQSPPKDVPVWLFAYSPCLSVGNSYTTSYFKRVFGYFPTVVGPVETVLQMLKRLRKLHVATVYLGSGARNVPFDKKHQEAIDSTRRHHKDEDIVHIHEEVRCVYEWQDGRLRSQAGKVLLLNRFKESLCGANPYNSFIRVPLLENNPAVPPRKAKRRDCRLPEDSDESLLAIVNEPDYKGYGYGTDNVFELDNEDSREAGPPNDALDVTKERFYRLQTLYDNNQVPDAVKSSDPAVQMLMLRLNNELHFVKRLRRKDVQVSKYVAKNLHKPESARIAEMCRIYNALEFDTFDDLVRFCSRQPKSGAGNLAWTGPVEIRGPEGENTMSVADAFKFVIKVCKENSHGLLLMKARKRLRTTSNKQITIPHFNPDIIEFAECVLTGQCPDQRLTERLEQLLTQVASAGPGSSSGPPSDILPLIPSSSVTLSSVIDLFLEEWQSYELRLG